MFGYSNNKSSPQACTIILIIVILANQGLLDGSSKSKNALTLLFLYWLCGFNGGCGNNMMLGNCNHGSMQVNQCGCGCGCKCKCKCKEKECKCKRVKVCCV